MRRTKNSMVAELEVRYRVVEMSADTKNGVYEMNLYDTTKKSKCSPAYHGEYVATIKMNKNTGIYSFNNMDYTDIETLHDSIEKYISELPYYHGYYDPMNVPSYMVECVINDYLKEIGFERTFNDYNEKYVMKDVFGTETFHLQYSVKHGTTSGQIQYIIGFSSFIMKEFNTLDEAIAIVNGFVSAYSFDIATKAIKSIESMKKSRNYNLEKVVVDDNFNVTVKSMKKDLIEKLEKELELLKASE